MSIKSVNTMMTKPPIAEEASLNAGFVSQWEGKGRAGVLGVLSLDKILRSNSDDSVIDG